MVSLSEPHVVSTTGEMSILLYIIILYVTVRHSVYMHIFVI